MPLTEEKKQALDDKDTTGLVQFNPRLHLVSHDEIAEAFARALESLVGAKYAVRIKSWNESTQFHLEEAIEMSATVKRCRADINEESA